MFPGTGTIRLWRSRQLTYVLLDFGYICLQLSRSDEVDGDCDVYTERWVAISSPNTIECGRRILRPDDSWSRVQYDC